jgi:transcriptional regulator with XRE-family HTH domain
LGNEHLRTAITRSGLTLEEFADTVGVDVKTVQRWLAGRVPYAGNRARVAGALDTPEHALWPDAVPVPTSTEAQELTTPVTGDAIAGYGHATDPAAPDGATLLRAAVERIEIAIPNLASQPALVELLRTCATDGRQARILIEDPDEQIEPLLGIDAIEIRASPSRENHVIYRADDEMLLVLTRIGPASASPPIIHLRRQADGGLFDRLADDFDDRWLEATPLTSPGQLHAYLADTELEPRLEPERSPAADPQTVRAPTRPPEAPTASPADAPRRWPRRPT